MEFTQYVDMIMRKDENVSQILSGAHYDDSITALQYSRLLNLAEENNRGELWFEKVFLEHSVACKVVKEYGFTQIILHEDCTRTGLRKITVGNQKVFIRPLTKNESRNTEKNTKCALGCLSELSKVKVALDDGTYDLEEFYSTTLYDLEGVLGYDETCGYFIFKVPGDIYDYKTPKYKHTEKYVLPENFTVDKLIECLGVELNNDDVTETYCCDGSTVIIIHREE